MISRRFFLSGAAAVTLTGGVASVANAASTKTIIYISAQDCPYCRNFDILDLARFSGFARMSGYTVRRVEVAHFRNIREPARWPKDLKPVLDQLSGESATPRFVVVENGVVTQDFLGAMKARNFVGLA